MARIVGVDIPDNKTIWISLTYIPGIGRHTSELILKEAQIEQMTKANKLSEDELKQVIGMLESPVYTKYMQLSGDLQKALAIYGTGSGGRVEPGDSPVAAKAKLDAIKPQVEGVKAQVEEAIKRITKK